MFDAHQFEPLRDPQVCDFCRHVGADVYLKVEVHDPGDDPIRDWRPTEFFAHQSCLAADLIHARRDGQERAKHLAFDAARMARERAEWQAMKAEAEARLADHEARFKAAHKVVAQSGLPLWDEPK